MRQFAITFRTLRGRDLLRCLIIPLIASWLIAGALGLLIARIQYAEVTAAFPADRVATEYQNRVDRELLHGLLIFMPQVPALAALLVLQIGASALGTKNLTIYGAVIGTLLAVIEIVTMAVFEVPLLYVVSVAAIVIGTGWFAGWLYMLRETTKP